MPEGAYPATLKLREDEWKRTRWFARTLSRAIVDVPQGIPSEGKGESGYDCGEQRSYGMTCPAETVEQGIVAMVESALRDRRRHNGNVMAVYPPPRPAEAT